jgi:hypothetical protein
LISFCGPLNASPHPLISVCLKYLVSFREQDRKIARSQNLVERYPNCLRSTNVIKLRDKILGIYGELKRSKGNGGWMDDEAMTWKSVQLILHRVTR